MEVAVCPRSDLAPSYQMRLKLQVLSETRSRQDFDTSTVRNDTGTSVKWVKRCRQDLPLEGYRAKTSSLPQKCGTPIIGQSASNRPSMRVSKDSGSTIWISISFTLHLHFNRGTSRIREIKAATSCTTAALLCSRPGGRWRVSWI